MAFFSFRSAMLLHAPKLKNINIRPDPGPRQKRWEFNQAIDGVQWPPRLKTLQFGQSFDQPLEAVSWPLSLEDLTFGGRCVAYVLEGVGQVNASWDVLWLPCSWR